MRSRNVESEGCHFMFYWVEWKLIVMSVVVGFLYMSISRFVWLCVIFKSRKFMELWVSCVGLSFILS